MVKLALENNEWVQLHTWESDSKIWTQTLEVLNHYKQEMKKIHGDNVNLKLLCGGDLVESFIIPNVWSDEHVSYEFGFYVVF